MTSPSRMDLDDIYETGLHDYGIASTAVIRLEKEYRRLVRHMEFVRKHWDSIHEIKERLANEEVEEARSVFDSLPHEVQIGLTRAASKGSVWTMEEGKLIKGVS